MRDGRADKGLKLQGEFYAKKSKGAEERGIAAVIVLTGVGVLENGAPETISFQAGTIIRVHPAAECCLR